MLPVLTYIGERADIESNQEAVLYAAADFSLAQQHRL